MKVAHFYIATAGVHGRQEGTLYAAAYLLFGVLKYSTHILKSGK